MNVTGKDSAADGFRLSRAAVLLSCLLCTAAASANWFRNTAQEAANKFEQGEYSGAAEEFTDSYRRGVALYRAGR